MGDPSVTDRLFDGVNQLGIKHAGKATGGAAGAKLIAAVEAGQRA